MVPKHLPWLFPYTWKLKLFSSVAFNISHISLWISLGSPCSHHPLCFRAAMQRKALFRWHLQDAYNYLLTSLYLNPLGKRSQVVYMASLRTSSSMSLGFLKFPYGIQDPPCVVHILWRLVSWLLPHSSKVPWRQTPNHASSSVALSPVWTHTVSSQCKNVACIRSSTVSLGTRRGINTRLLMEQSPGLLGGC